MPEQLPTPEASIKQLEAEERKQRRRAGQGQPMPQLPLFPDEDVGASDEADGPTAEQ